MHMGNSNTKLKNKLQQYLGLRRHTMKQQMHNPNRNPTSHMVHSHPIHNASCHHGDTDHSVHDNVRVYLGVYHLFHGQSVLHYVLILICFYFYS